MHPTTLERSLPRQLESLLALDAQPAGWGSADLAGLLRHQLSVPLRGELSRLGLSPPKCSSTSGGHPGDSRPTFADVLTAPSPPLDLLGLVKEFGKVCDQDGDYPLPAQVAAVLYYAAVAAARVRQGKRISRLSDSELRGGVEWALRQSWMDPRLRPLFEAVRAIPEQTTPRRARRSDDRFSLGRE